MKIDYPLLSRSHFAGGGYTKRAMVAEIQPIIQPKKMHQMRVMRCPDVVEASMVNTTAHAIAQPTA